MPPEFDLVKVKNKIVLFCVSAKQCVNIGLQFLHVGSIHTHVGSIIISCAEGGELPINVQAVHVSCSIFVFYMH